MRLHYIKTYNIFVLSFILPIFPIAADQVVTVKNGQFFIEPAKRGGISDLERAILDKKNSKAEIGRKGGKIQFSMHSLFKKSNKKRSQSNE